jgi:hypothetical protein
MNLHQGIPNDCHGRVLGQFVYDPADALHATRKQTEDEEQARCVFENSRDSHVLPPFY